MPGFLPDSACMVASLSPWHQHYERAAAELERRHARGEQMVIAAPTLVETYSVLTRLPRPRRLVPSMAIALIQDNFVERGSVISLESAAYLRLLQRAATDQIAGGRIYDAVIAACVRMAGADVVLTFNERDFLPFADTDLTIVVPGTDVTA